MTEERQIGSENTVRAERSKTTFSSLKPTIVTRLGTLMLLYYGYKILAPLIRGETTEANKTILWLSGLLLLVAGIVLSIWIIRWELQERREAKKR